MLNKLQELLLALAIVILSFLLWNPFSIGMTNSTEMMIVLGLTLVFAVFAVFIWREKL